MDRFSHVANGNKLEDFWRGLLGGGPRHKTYLQAERKSPSVLGGDCWGVKYGRMNKGVTRPTP